MFGLSKSVKALNNGRWGQQNSSDAANVIILLLCFCQFDKPCMSVSQWLNCCRRYSARHYEF